MPVAIRQRRGNANDEAADAISQKQKETQEVAEAVYSSGAPFYPPSNRYWRIGGEWYDFNDFMDKHPGGAHVLRMARDRFEDSTFAFESHHHDATRVRAIIRKYKVSESVVNPKVRPERAPEEEAAWRAHFDKGLDSKQAPKLLGDDAFYSVLRRRVNTHLKAIGCPHGGPTTPCIILFWLVFVAWLAMGIATYMDGRLWMAFFWGFPASWMGAFGHNWVHQPKYYSRGWAILSLDLVGFSSEQWYREHVLQHHMYTNTPWDNHFYGLEPFIITRPTVERGFLHKYIMPYINPILLCFGTYANYVGHTINLLKGEEYLSVGKFLMPLQIVIMAHKWGWHGVLLMFVCHSVVSVYYFTMALMNHNATHCTDVDARNKSRDWGEAQLHSSADWGVNLSFLQAIIYLWLNYHTVHHLFPRTDFAHHPAIQQILIRTCKEFGVKYVTASPFVIYRQMVNSFATPNALFKEITVYGGAI